ncbi:MAG: Na+:solute symporter [Flavobacteriaceae bacterium]|nr:MAG: Na+:solute symporter [Flavobacteriaceae bacterium]
MIHLETLDFLIIAALLSITVLIGVWASKTAGKDSDEFFLSGKNMPWWLMGTSMVATTFSTDTPNLVTDIVRRDGVAGNWVWWAFLITGLLTVFVYAKLWRRSNVTTDLEFYSLRYGGKPAKFLRTFRSVYLGVAFNVMAMAGVTLAAIKIGHIMFGAEPWLVVIIAGAITVFFSAFGGFKGVVYTDFFLFFMAMVGSVASAYYIVNLPEVGGLCNLMSQPVVQEKQNFFPTLSNKEQWMTLFIIPLAVQWWSAWYPGAEPGGGGYVAQRMLAAKDENHAVGATFFFNFMHYAVRPWPWILVAFASLIVFPDVESIGRMFPNIPADKLGHDLAYPAMLTKLPAGLLGLVLASLLAAYISTISTHLNWGSSYIVNDFYKLEINPDASEKQLVFVGQISTVLLMVVSGFIAMSLTNATQIFNIIIMFGAGTGLIFILRWFWWRINAWSEISAMFASGVVSLLLNFTDLGKTFFGENGKFESHYQFPFVVLVTTLVWVLITFLTKPETDQQLFAFYRRIKPGGPGWKLIKERALISGETLEESNQGWSLPYGILAMLVGCVSIYSCLFMLGNFLYGKPQEGFLLLGLFVASGFVLLWIWKKIKNKLI